MLLGAISYFFGINYEWLANGEGEMFKPVPKESEGNEALHISEKPGAYRIDEMFVYLPTISGNIADIGFRKEWIDKYGDYRNLSLMYVEGDSMEPTLHAGDIVLIDRSKKAFTQGGIYAISCDGMQMIKRLQIIYPSGKIEVISDNPKYSRWTAEPEEINIIGRVIWFCRELK